MLISQQHLAGAATLSFHQPGFLFNEPAHLAQQRSDDYSMLTAVNQDTQQVMARCAFFIENNTAFSPGAAPFGSVEFDETLPDTVLTALIDRLLTKARQAGCRMIQLIHYPRCYAPSQTDRLRVALLTSGFYILESHPTFYLPVTNRPFAQGITASERRRLRKCQRGNFQFAHWQQYDPAIVINFLLDTYAQLGYRLSLSPERLLHLLATFPDQFLVFTLRDDVQLIALTITVRVRPDILYNFLPASRSAYHAFSPMVMLLDGVYAYCQHEQISLLDLGMALDSAYQPKASLARFKRNLGAQESPKYVFRKALQG